MKIYKKGNYIFIEDGGVLKQEFTSQVKITKSAIDSVKYTIQSDDLGLLNVTFADITDENGDAYVDQATFETFYQSNTGFNPATVGSVETVADDLATHEANETDAHDIANRIADFETTSQLNDRDTANRSTDNHTDGTTNKVYSATDKTKLAGISTGATANDTDTNLKARANHTGTQTASTISDFDTTVTNSTHAVRTDNPHSVTKSQVGLSNVPDVDTTTTANITDSTNKRFVTDANLTTIGNQSGTNTGDQTSIVGITGTLAQFNTAVTDADLMKLGTNVVVVNDWTTDFPAVVSGNITLDNNKTYIIRGSQNLGTNTITFGTSNILTGWDRSSDQLIYTGTASQLINSNKDCTVSNITLAAITAGGSVFNFTGTTNKVVIQKNIFGSCKSLGTISGGDVLVFDENLATLCTAGLTVSGTYNFTEITDTLWEENVSTFTCLSIPSGTFGQLKISRNIFSVASTQTAISVGTPTVANAVVEACDFIGAGTYVTGINNLTPNWILRINRDVANKVKNSIIYMPRAIERSWFQVRSSNATRVSVGTTSSGFGTATNNTDSTTSLTKYTTSATSGSYAGLESTAFTELPIDASAVFSAVVKMDSDITNQRLWIGLQSGTLLNTDDQSGSGVAFRFSTVAGDTGWRAIVDDATTQTVSANIGTVTADTYYYLELRVDYANSKCYFQVNNGGWTTINAVPLTGTKMGWVCEMTNTATGARAFNLSRIDCNHL